MENNIWAWKAESDKEKESMSDYFTIIRAEASKNNYMNKIIDPSGKQWGK